MSKLKYIIFIAVLANLLSFILFRYAASQPGGSGIAMVFTIIWLPIIWLATIVVAGIVLVAGRKTVFKSPTLKWTLAASFFCTPVPAILVFMLMNKKREFYNGGIRSSFANGKIYRTEEWYMTSTSKLFVIKRFVASAEEELYLKEKAYKKDSLWIYFDDKGDTISVEQYAKDSLISKRLK